MTGLRSAAGWLLGFAILAGTVSDVAPKNPPLVLGGYRVLAADFHVHSFPLSWATLGPWDTVLEARHQGLDAIALTPHNHVWVAKAGRWFSRRIGGPTVLVGEEIHAARFHMLAVGIEATVDWRQSVAGAIDEVHKQGGVAIAAHPVAESWPAYDAESMRDLDGAEVLQPIAYTSEQATRELREFYGRKRLTAIGSSDYHGPGPLGLCRTYVFVREDTEQGILEALREGRTVVYDRGQVFGDPEMIELGPALRESGSSEAVLVGLLKVFSRVAGIVGLIGLLVF